MLTAQPEPDAASHGAGDHSVRFYDQDQQLLDEVSEFLDDALRAGGHAVVFATPEHCAELNRRLNGLGGHSGAGPGWFSGSLVLRDAQDMLDLFMVDGQPDEERFEREMQPILAQAPAGRPLHAFGEMVALLCEQGDYDAALALEGLWNNLLTRCGFSLFCAYPWRLFSAHERTHAFQHVCAAHSRLLGATGEATTSASIDAGSSVIHLRQQARVLQTEVERRRQAEQTLRQRERELADFLDNASEGIHKVAADGTILYANRAELDLLGYRWDEYVGHSMADFYVDETQVQCILEQLKLGETLHDQPVLLRCKDGSHKPVSLYSNGYFENGQLVYTRCFTRDASERQAREQAAAEREQLLDSVRKAARVKDEFLAMLGHELRNPLAPIVTALQLMRMRGESGTSREQAIIQRQVDHLVRLVDDLLDISRITRGKIELKKERCELQAVLTKAVEQASILLEQRSHRLSIAIEPGLRCDCDPVRLGQVVTNLLTNAARYTEVSGHITLRAWREPDQHLAISVRDNGSGIPAELLAKVFDLFYQGERGVDRAKGGLGIGLAIVRSLVELHGGSVEARSAGVGQGSEFVVHLPGLAPQAKAAATAAHASYQPLHARRIMVVDDNADAAELLGELLRASGHAVTVFTDPASALQALPQLQPAVAVLDLGLPVMDGYELAARVRSICGDSCALVALTGYGQENDRTRTRAAGFHSHLVKPVAHEQLLRVLDALTAS